MYFLWCYLEEQAYTAQFIDHSAWFSATHANNKIVTFPNTDVISP